MDIGSCYEDAHSEAASHYVIHNEMKQEFLNHQATLLFHIFEKDRKKMFPELSGNDLKEKLQLLGISTENNFGFLLKADIEISLNDIEVYVNEMKKFWIEFFDIALITE